MGPRLNAWAETFKDPRDTLNLIAHLARKVSFSLSLSALRPSTPCELSILNDPVVQWLLFTVDSSLLDVVGVGVVLPLPLLKREVDLALLLPVVACIEEDKSNQ